MSEQNDENKQNEAHLIRLARTEFEIEKLQQELVYLKNKQQEVQDQGNRLDKEGALRAQLIDTTNDAIQKTINGLLANLDKTKNLVDEYKNVAIDHAQCATHRQMILDLKKRSERIETEFENRLAQLEIAFHDRKLYLKTLLKVGGAAVGMVTTLTVLLSNIDRCREAIEHLIDFISRSLFQNNSN